MKERRKSFLMKKYNIKGGGGGNYGVGFFDCLELMHKKIIILKKRLRNSE